MTPEDILPTYEREADTWARNRDCTLWEEPALSAALDAQVGARVLDLGCGSGQPIAAWFVDQGCDVTGVDGARAMIRHFRAALPRARGIRADMRGLRLEERFDVILGFNSFFHLNPADQRAMFPVFADHAAPGARLLLTTGPAAGEALGTVGASTVYHASLDPSDYRRLFENHGFRVDWFRPEDPELKGHSVWLARARH